jgi:hypothetical protein
MANYSEVAEDLKEQFLVASTAAGLDNHITIKVVNDSLQKKITKAIKVPELYEFTSGDKAIIIINELVFEALPPDQQKMVVDETLAEFYFDAEKDKLVLKKPDINTYSLLLEKNTIEKYLALKESIKSVYAKFEEDKA